MPTKNNRNLHAPPIDRRAKHGSKPERMDMGECEWKATNYLEKEWCHETNQPKPKTALRDERPGKEAYRSNYEATFGHK